MLYAMVEGPTDSEGEEVELDDEDGHMYYQDGRLVLENELDQDPADEEVYMISCYEIDEEGRDDGSDTVRVESRKLPVYDGIIENTCLRMIADSGATGQAISERIIDEVKSIRTFSCEPKRIRIAGKGKTAIHTITKVALFDLKLSRIPEHTVAAYIVPLDEPDLILRCGWLGKYKAMEDWDHESLEITMNGRRYQLNPPIKAPSLRVVDDDEELKELKEQLRWVDDMEKEECIRHENLNHAEGIFEKDIDYILATRIEMKQQMKEKKENALKEFEKLAELDDKEELKLCKRGKELHGWEKRQYFRNLTLRWLKQFCKDLT